MNVKITQEQKIKVLNGRDLAEIMQKVLKRENKIDRNKEHLWVVCLANNNRILMVELVTLGTVNSTPVEAMEVFSFALQKQAVKIVLVHNHPSGETTPSHSDKFITDKMMAIGDFIKLQVVDHLIITEDDFFSFKDSGLLEQIRKESNFDLTFAKQEKIKEQVYYLQMQIEEKDKTLLKAKKAAQKEIAKARLANKKEVALKAIVKGYPNEEVMDLSDLTLRQVAELRAKYETKK